MAEDSARTPGRSGRPRPSPSALRTPPAEPERIEPERIEPERIERAEPVGPAEVPEPERWEPHTVTTHNPTMGTMGTMGTQVRAVWAERWEHDGNPSPSDGNPLSAVRPRCPTEPATLAAGWPRGPCPGDRPGSRPKGSRWL